MLPLKSGVLVWPQSTFCPRSAVVCYPLLWLFLVTLAGEAFPSRAVQTVPISSGGRQVVLSVPVPDMPPVVVFLLRLWSGKSWATHKGI